MDSSVYLYYIKMSEAEVTFIYKGNNISIKCDINEKMKDIISKFLNKIENVEKNNLYFFYTHYKNKVNEELTFTEQADEIDKNRYKMDITVLNNNENIMIINSDNGVIYVGNFKNGIKEGKGAYVYPNADLYEGDFKNNMREGKGIFYYIHGDRYEGEYKNDKKEGKGIMHFKNGDRYEG